MRYVVWGVLFLGGCAQLVPQMSSSTTSTTSQASETAGEKEKAEAVLQIRVDEFNKRHGGTLKAVIDWPSFEGHLDRGQERRPALFCGEVVDMANWACGQNPDGKAVIAATMKTLTCSFKADTGPKIQLAHSGTAFVATFDWSASDISDVVVPYLENKLVKDTPSSGETLSIKQRKDRKDGEKELQLKVDKFNQACGGNLTAVIDWPSFEGHYVPGNREGSAGLYCGEIAVSAARVCGDADAKAVVAAKLKTLKCSFKADGPGPNEMYTKLRLSHSGTAFVASYDWSTANIFDVVIPYVETKL